MSCRSRRRTRWSTAKHFGSRLGAPADRLDRDSSVLSFVCVDGVRVGANLSHRIGPVLTRNHCGLFEADPNSAWTMAELPRL
jgi:hypothetical protein